MSLFYFLTNLAGDHPDVTLLVTIIIIIPTAIWRHFSGARPLNKTDLVIIAILYLILVTRSW